MKNLHTLGIINKVISFILILAFIILAEINNFTIAGLFLWGFNREAETPPQLYYVLTIAIFISALVSLIALSLFRISYVKNKSIFKCWNELKIISPEIIALYLSLYFLLIISILIPPLLMIVVLIIPLYFVWPIVIVARDYDLISKKIAH